MTPPELFARDLVLCNLGSGSRGNATYVGTGRRGLLVDAGLSVRECLHRLASRGIPEAAVEGVVVTHSHADHVHAVRRLVGSRGIPVYANADTAREAGWLGEPWLRVVPTGTPFQAAGLVVDPVPIPHDTADPVAFVFACGPLRAAVATDLGRPTRLVVEKLLPCALVMLESNHDPDMLMSGPYPWHLKQRVRGSHGHLSNRQALEILEGILPGAVRHVLLAHLSEQNNDPRLAHGEARARLDALGRRDVGLSVLEQREASPVYRLDDAGVRVSERL